MFICQCKLFSMLLKKYCFIVIGLPLIAIISGLIFGLPRFAESVTPADICDKHNVSSGEFTPCFYCHNAEAEGEIGFTINSDSRFCLSCHDGSTKEMSQYSSLGSVAERISRPSPIGHITGIDHPFAVSYIEAKNISATLKLKDLPDKPVKVFNGKIECASCHDPHSCANPLFLRITNDRSKLCLACHEM